MEYKVNDIALMKEDFGDLKKNDLIKILEVDNTFDFYKVIKIYEPKLMARNVTDDLLTNYTEV